MKSDLFISENEDLRLSSVYLGYETLLVFEKDGKQTIYDLFAALRKRQENLNHENFMNALTFLFSSGLIEFKKPYLELNDDKN